MSFRSRAFNTLVKGFRANSRLAVRTGNYNCYRLAPSSNVCAMLFSTAADDEKKEGLSPEEAKKMASEMLFNEKDEGNEKKEEEKKVEFVPPKKEEGATEEKHEFQAAARYCDEFDLHRQGGVLERADFKCFGCSGEASS